MKKDSKFKKLLEKKGFTVALYACAAVIVALAGIISANNISSINKAKNNPSAEQNELEQANQSNVKSYLEGDQNRILDNSAANENQVNENQANENQKKQESVNDKNTAKAAAPEKQETPAEKSTVNSGVKTQSGEAKKTNEKSSENPSENENQKNIQSNEDEKVFSLFDDTKEMSWPVSGRIVMDYSMETAIYDKTLDQYRTNDSICIEAPVGTEVKASAEGVVSEISKDRENGNIVMIDHGNGWYTTYSQLQDNIQVKKGDVVEEGKTIGTVAEPTYYSILLGPHLEFKLTKDDKLTDPKLVLAQYDE